MRSSWPRAAAVLAVAIPVLVLAGCSEKTPGNASGSTGASTPTATSGSCTTASPSKGPVPRPKTINLKGVDPCTLLTDPQRQTLGFDRPPQPGKSDNFGGAASCTLSREDRAYIASVIVVTDVGIEGYTNGRYAVEPTPTTVAGFPAVLGKPKNSAPVCYLGVDVSDGQHLAIQISTLEGTTPAKLCELAPVVAEAATSTLASK